MAVPALKEWGVIVRALLAGEQVLDVRKGGLREEGRRFELKAPRCWLYPTVEHERVELIKPAYRRWIEQPPGPASTDRSVRIDGWADVVGVATVVDPEELARLDSKLIWTHDYAESRLNWKRREPLMVLALRSYRLDEPITIPWRDEYGGCTSWLQIDSLPPDPASLPGEPALSDDGFAARVSLIERELGRPFVEPG